MHETTPTPTAPSQTQPQRCGLALAGFLLGLVALCTCFTGPLPGLAAVICSQAGLALVRESGGRLKGRGLARAGLVMGYAALAECAVMVFMFSQPWHETPSNIVCTNNAKQILLGALMYADDHAGECPSDLGLLRQSYINDDQIFLCPGQKNRGRSGECDYEYHGAGVKLSKLEQPRQTILLADRLPHPGGVFVVGFADGHAVTVSVPPGESLAPVAEGKGWLLPKAEVK